MHTRQYPAWPAFRMHGGCMCATNIENVVFEDIASFEQEYQKW